MNKQEVVTISKVLYNDCKDKGNISKRSLKFSVIDFIESYDKFGAFTHNGVGKLRGIYNKGKYIPDVFQTTAYKSLKIAKSLNMITDSGSGDGKVLSKFEGKLTKLLEKIRV